MPLNRDILNMDHANHAITLSDFMEDRVGSKMQTDRQQHCWKRKAVRSCYAERGSTCMKNLFRSARKCHMLEASRKHMGTCRIHASSIQTCSTSHVADKTNSAFPFRRLNNSAVSSDRMVCGAVFKSQSDRSHALSSGKAAPAERAQGE